MNRTSMGTRVGLIVLAALLALPLAPTASPVAAKQRPRTVTRTFRNPAPIELPIAQTSPAPASLYPSPIAVRGLKGTIRDVNLTLTDFSHDFPRDVYVLLVGPDGQTAVVMADVSGGFPVTDVTLTLDDEAAEPLPEGSVLRSGTFRPTNDFGAITFNAPAPSAGANSALSVFDGANPNGTWRLFVQDANGVGQSGLFAGGWELEIAAKAKHKKKR